jgi:hypothetical protein
MPEIIHDEAGRRFIMKTNNGEAYVPYRLQGNTVDFYYSFVPPEFRGQGLGRELVKACKAWAESNGYEIQAGCGYVAAVLVRLGRGDAKNTNP